MKFIPQIVRTLVVALALAAASQASAVLVTYFNFEDSNFTSDLPSPPTTTMTTTFVAGSATFSAGTGTTLNAATGNVQVTNTDLRLEASKGNNNGASIQFSVSTLGLSNLALSYATQNVQGIGFTTQTLAYSVNGSAFTPFGSFTPTLSNAYEIANFNLASITGLNNQASITLQITFSGAGNGNNEFTDIDNIQLDATPIPEPATAAGGSLALLGIGYMQRRRLVALCRRGGKQS